MSSNARSKDSVESRANSKLAKTKAGGAVGNKAQIETTIEASRNRDRMAKSTDKITAEHSSPSNRAIEKQMRSSIDYHESHKEEVGIQATSVEVTVTDGPIVTQNSAYLKQENAV